MQYNEIQFNVPVSVRVKGNNKWLKNVMLLPMPDGAISGKVMVRTGRRGRPAHLPVGEIVQIRTLATA